MQLSFNNDNYFFTIESDTLVGDDNVNRLASSDIISFSVTEELGKLTTGTLTIHDPQNIFSKIFRCGSKFDITFGYKKSLQTVLKATGVRSHIKCVAMTPSGSGEQTGEIVYSITFYGLEFLIPRKIQVYDSGTLFDAVLDMMDDMKVDIPLVNFEAGSMALTTENSIKQRETSFRLLKILAQQHRCHFIVGNNSKGKRIGIFIDNSKLQSDEVKKWMKDLTATNEKKELFYNFSDKSNVLKYSWQHHIGENGQGDNTTISYIQGKPVITQYVAETQSVLTYQLNEGRIKAKFKGQTAGAAIDLTRNYLGAKSFDEVKWAFDKVEETTAPQGMGFTINVSMQGDPSMIVMREIMFRGSWPAPLTQSISLKSPINFFVKKVTHNFSKAQYLTEVEINDTYNLTGTFIQIQRGDLVGQ